MKVKSVSNDEYKHIIYYPILDRNGLARAIIEVCYSHSEKIPKDQVINEPIKIFLDQFSLQMVSFQTMLKSFCSSMQVVLEKNKTLMIMHAFA